MSRRALNLVAVAGAVAAIVWVISGLLIEGGGTTTAVSTAVDPIVTPSETPSPIGEEAKDPAEQGWRGYALSIPDVDGMPPDLQPGDRLEIWVAWDPPITTKTKIEPLVDRVLYERTVPPTIPGEAPVAVVLVPDGKVDELMWGDRYGALAVVIADA